MFHSEWAERNCDRNDLENYYYYMIYRVVRDPTQANKAIHLRKLKAIITRINNVKQCAVLLDIEDRDRITGDPTIHPYLNSQKRRT